MKHPNLLTVKHNTIGKILNSNRENLLFTTDCKQLYTKVHKLFTDANIDTPKSRQILQKLSMSNNIVSSVTYIQNILFKASNMGV